MRCAFYGCDFKKTRTSSDNKISLHHFPKDIKLCKRWVFLCRRKDEFSVKSARICSKHFAVIDFIPTNPVYEQHGIIKQKRLKPNVVPSVLLLFGCHSKEVLTERSMRLQKRSAQSSSTVTNMYYDSSESDLPCHMIDNTKLVCSANNSPVHMDYDHTVLPSSIMEVEIDNATCTETESSTVCKVSCSTQTDAINIEEKVRSTFLSDSGTQTDPIIPSYSEIQNVIIKLNKEIYKRDQKIQSIGKIFTNGQLKKLECPEKRAKWSSDDIGSAIAIHTAGPRPYRLLLKKNYPLPAVVTLKKWCAKIEVYPGILQCVLNLMKAVNMKQLDKICILSFDEMKVKEKIVYNKTKYETLTAAKYVQVAMIRGLFGNWKQPIYYDFDQKMTRELLFKIINAVYDCEFEVAAIVCDLGGSNQGLLRDLKITVNAPFFINPSNSDKKMYVFADVPHLIKLIRNNFVDNDGFVIDGVEINKTVIEELISITNDKSDLSVAYKISAENLKVRGAERQKVKLATKLFSHTVSSAILRAGSLGLLTSSGWLKCSQFFKQVNDWFDCLNVRVPHQDSRQRVHGLGLSEPLQFAIIEKMSELVLKMRIKGKSAMMPFQKGIIMTNNSLKLLYDDLKSTHRISYLLTYRLNQDVLENFFGVIRAKGGLHDHPDRLEFMYRLRSYILGRNEGSLSNNSNTLVDDTPDLDSTSNMSANLFGTLASTINVTADEIDELESLQYDGLEHLAGYICHRIKDPSLVVQNSVVNTSQDSTFTWTNQLTEGFLQKPTDAMMKEMEKMESIFQEYNGSHIIFCRNYVQTLISLSTHISLDQKVKEIFFRSRMFFRIKTLNMEIVSNNRRKSRKSYKTIS